MLSKQTSKLKMAEVIGSKLNVSKKKVCSAISTSLLKGSLLAGLWPLPRKAFAKLVVSLLPLMDIKLTVSWISSSLCGPHS